MPSDQRDKILDLLSAATTPLDAADVAARLDLHVTTARFHLNKLVDDAKVTTTTIRTAGVGRPRVGYRIVNTPPVDALIGHLLGRLGSTEHAREFAGAEAGRLWADEYGHIETSADLPDPVLVVSNTLHQLGFRVSGSMSAFGTHELRICSCPLRDLAKSHAEVARGVARGVIEQALAASSPALASQYSVHVLPDPSGGDCEIMLRLMPLRHIRPAISAQHV